MIRDEPRMGHYKEFCTKLDYDPHIERDVEKCGIYSHESNHRIDKKNG